ncbi:MAG: 3-isopropylmalate dehydratase small subunit [Rhodospirillales bacterium]|nr:3-isopropylmalate dehydratase small subunit [Rhodospirillales bacterium]
MQPFRILSAIAAPLPMANVDTDMIIPKQFLRTIRRTGLGAALFYDMRTDAQGHPVSGFVLDREPYRDAKILIAGDNFGCGSSREHAPWALLDFGLRCIIAPGFADIFYNNCFKNGILPVVLPPDAVDALMLAAQDSPETPVTVDLEKQTVARGNSLSFHFSIDPFRKQCLMNGLDDIGLTLEKAGAIADYEKKAGSERSWL